MSRLLCCCGLLAALLSCTPPVSQAPLRVAINPWPGYEFVFLAEQKGFFAEQGVDVTVLQMSSLSDARRAFERGQVDGVGCTIIEMLQARELSPRFPQIVYVPDYSNGGDVLMATPDIADVPALRGRRVAFEPGTLNLFILTRALEKNGMTVADVQLVPMPQTSMQDALTKREVDAMVTYPPVSINLEKSQLAKIIFSSREIPGEVLDVIVFDADVIKNRKTDIQKFLRGLEAAYRYAEQNPEDAYAIMARREGIAVDDFRQSIERDLHLINAAGQAPYFGEDGHLIKAIEGVQKTLQRNGELRGEYLPASFVPPKHQFDGT